MANSLTLLENQTADVAAGAGLICNFNAPNSDAIITVWGVWGGATVALYFLAPDGVTWIASTGGTLTADGHIPIECTPTAQFCLAVSGATATTVLNASYEGV